MKKLTLAFSSKDRVELTQRTIERVNGREIQLFWNDGSVTDDGQYMHQVNPGGFDGVTRTRVIGGPDRAIVFALSQMLKHSASRESADYFGLLENDVLLDPDWLEPTMSLFDNPEGLSVGAVSARSFEDRILIQRDGYAIMHNVGAGHVIFTREAAQIILANYRTGWWPENRAVFSQLSGLDIGKWAAFHHNEQMITADWSWDTILAAHGLATVALTPSKATMIGQELTMEQQGLKLTTGSRKDQQCDDNFMLFRDNLQRIRSGERSIGPVDHLLRTRGGSIIFPHHAERHGGLFSGKWTTRWNQACGPFVYVAGEGAIFSMSVFGACAFHVAAGPVKLHDTATGFSTEVDLTGQDHAVTIAVPRDMQSGIVRLTFGPGACLCGIETTHEQPAWKDVTFDYSKLPEVQHNG